MPRRFRRKLRRRPAKRYRRRKAIIPRSLAPSRKLIRCQAVDYFSPSYAAGAISFQYVQGNSIDDPFMGSGGGQPLGYDQWKAFYKKAKVLSCKVVTEWHNGSSGALVCGISTFGKTQSGVALTNYEHLIECPGTKHKVLSPDVDKCVLVSKRSTKKMLKIKNMTDSENTEFDLVTETPPTDLYTFHIWSQPMDQTTALAGVQLLVKVEYIVMLYDPLIPSRSTET